MRKSCFGQTCRSKISICNSKATFLKHGCFSSLSKSRVFVSEPRALKNISDLIFITSDSNCMGSMSKLIDNVFTTTSICFRSLKIKFIVIDFETFRDRPPLHYTHYQVLFSHCYDLGRANLRTMDSHVHRVYRRMAEVVLLSSLGTIIVGIRLLVVGFSNVTRNRIPHLPAKMRVRLGTSFTIIFIPDFISFSLRPTTRFAWTIS